MVFKKNKILVVSNVYPTLNSPQAGTFVRNSVEGLESSGFKVDVIYLLEESNKSFFKKLYCYMFFYLDTAKAIVFGNYNIVYCHYVSHSSIAISLLKLLGKKFIYVAHVHGSDVLQEENVGASKFLLKKWLAKLALRQADLIVSPSNYYKFDVICPLYQVPKEKVFISPSGGVDLNTFKPVVKNVIKEQQAFTIGFAGRLTLDKGILDFIETTKKVWLTDPSLLVIIIGDGPLLNKVIEFTAYPNVKHYRKLNQQQLAVTYQQLDLFVFPTKRRTESLGLVGIEAMACGVPVVAYAMGGPKSYIKEGINGYLVKKSDVDSMVLSILNYISLSFIEKEKYILEAQQTAKDFCSLKVSTDFSNLFFRIINE